MTTINLDIHNLAQRIHDFLADYDPCFGYAEGVDGQENEEQWVQSIEARLIDGKTYWFVTTVSELVISVPECEADGDALLADIITLGVAA